MSEQDSNPQKTSNVTRDELQNRLHDQGFTHYTMPSVVRNPKQLSHQTPLVARLYSLNNNLIKSVK